MYHVRVSNFKTLITSLLNLHWKDCFLLLKDIYQTKIDMYM